MSLLEEIDQKLHTAMKSHDQRAAECLRMLKSKVIEKRTSAGFKGEVTDAVVREVAAAYVKQLTRAIAEFEKGGEAGVAHIEKLTWEIAVSRGLSAEVSRRGGNARDGRGCGQGEWDHRPRAVRPCDRIVMKGHKDEVDAALVRRLVEEILSKGA